MDLRAIIGPNGAGKTTLFNVITGAIRPSGGSVFFAGRDISGLPPHQITRLGLSRSFQLTNIFPELTVRENVWLGVNARKRAPWYPFTSTTERAVSEELERLCIKVGLAEKMDANAGSLSHGDQRLLEIAIALSLNPRLLLLDEPTQGVSPQEVEVINGVIRDIAKTRGVMLIEHNMATVLNVANVVTVLHYGKIIVEGTPAEVIEDPRVQEVYLGTVRAKGSGR
jgi:branched-chain amino acid transport system ATP-binding protein